MARVRFSPVALYVNRKMDKKNKIVVLIPKNRSLRAYVDLALKDFTGKDPEIIEARGEDIPLLVEKLATSDKEIIGMTGQDLLKEYQLKAYDSNVTIIKKITWKDKKAMFGRPVLCLLGPGSKKFDDLSKKLTVCVNKKYRNIAKKYLNLFEENGYSFEKIYISGSTENVYQGISDLVIDIVYTGSSMKNAGLDVYDKIMESDFVIIGVENDKAKKSSN
jgi:ATP phosphoribosyltransferase